jgi:hypothetical protein
MQGIAQFENLATLFMIQVADIILRSSIHNRTVALDAINV